MCHTGMDDFQAADDDTLHAGMARAAHLGLPVAVHAESAELTSRLAARAVSEGRTTMRDYLASRPVVAELEAIERAIAIARETGCSLHVVHVSTGSGVRLVGAAREEGVDVTCETCPHYLALDDEDALALGMVAKCSPPLRPRCRARRPLGHASRRARRPRRIGSLSEPARAQARRRRLRRLGRHRRLPDAAAGAADGGPVPRSLARGDREPLRRGARAAVRPCREGLARSRRGRRSRAGRPVRRGGADGRGAPLAPPPQPVHRTPAARTCCQNDPPRLDCMSRGRYGRLTGRAFRTSRSRTNAGGEVVGAKDRPRGPAAKGETCHAHEYQAPRPGGAPSWWPCSAPSPSWPSPWRAERPPSPTPSRSRPPGSTSARRRTAAGRQPTTTAGSTSRRCSARR